MEAAAPADQKVWRFGYLHDWSFVRLFLLQTFKQILTPDTSSACIASGVSLYYRVQLGRNDDLIWTLVVLFRWVLVCFRSNLEIY